MVAGGGRGKAADDFHVDSRSLVFGSILAVEVSDPVRGWPIITQWLPRLRSRFPAVPHVLWLPEGAGAAALDMNGQPVLLSRERTAFGVSRIDGRHDQRYPQVGYDREEAMLVLDLSTGDSLLVPVHDDLGELHLVDTPAGDVAAIHLPFAPWRVWSPSPGGGYAAAWGGTYEIAEIGLAGDTLRVIRRDVPPRRITPAAWSLARQQVVLELRPYIGSAAAMDTPLPPHQQQLVALTYSRDGRQL